MLTTEIEISWTQHIYCIDPGICVNPFVWISHCVLFEITLPMLAILIHGALRMRSTKLKVSNKIEFNGVKRTHGGSARSLGSRTGSVVID